MAEFAADGAAHDARRADRLAGHRGNAAREAIADDERELRGRVDAADGGRDAKFLRKARAEAYVDSGATLADEVNRRKARHQRSAKREDEP